MTYYSVRLYSCNKYHSCPQRASCCASPPFFRRISLTWLSASLVSCIYFYWQLKPDWTEEYVESLFSSIGEVASTTWNPVCNYKHPATIFRRSPECRGHITRWFRLAYFLMSYVPTKKYPLCIVAVLSKGWPTSRTLDAFYIPGQELEVKLIRDRHRGIVAGYGFIDFQNHETAKFVLETLNGKPIGKEIESESN